MKTILYARVSTADQTIAHQRKQAEAVGFQIDMVLPMRACRASIRASRIVLKVAGSSICSEPVIRS